MDEKQVQFDEENYTDIDYGQAPKNSTMVTWVMKTGLVNDKSGAHYVLLGILVLIVLATVIVFMIGSPDRPQFELTQPVAGPDDPNFRR